MTSLPTHKPRPHGVDPGSRVAVFLSAMVLYTIPPSWRQEFLQQLTVLMLVTGGALAYGLLKFRNR
jgi:hypothetical protein